MNYRYCIVPTCKSKNKPTSVEKTTFIMVPSDAKRRNLWLKTVGRQDISANRKVFVCENHFNLPEDMANYMEWKVMGVRKLMKKDVIPHKFVENNVMNQTHEAAIQVNFKPKCVSISNNELDTNIQLNYYDVPDIITNFKTETRDGEDSTCEFPELRKAESENLVKRYENPLGKETELILKTEKDETEGNENPLDMFYFSSFETPFVKETEFEVKTENGETVSKSNENIVNIFPNEAVASHELCIKSEYDNLCNNSLSDYQYKEFEENNDQMQSDNDFDKNQVNDLEVSNLTKHKCSKCSYETNRKYHLKRHSLCHESIKDAKVVYKCDKCMFQTLHQENLKRHSNRHDITKKTIIHKCDECDYQTIYKFHLSRHLESHKNAREGIMQRCPLCGFETLNRHSLRNHMNRHVNPKPTKMYICDKCSYQTPDKSNLKKHIRRHLGREHQNTVLK